MAKCAIRLMRRTVGRTAGGGPSRFRRILARMRHDPDPDPDPDPDGDGYAVRGLAFTHPRGPVVLPHAEGWDQLIYAASGVMTVHTADGVWVVPPDRAVWVPSGLGNRVEMGGRTAIRTLYLAAGLARLPP